MLVDLEEGIAAQYEIYAAVCGRSVEKAIAAALLDWMESVGQVHIESRAAQGVYKNVASNSEPC